MMNNFTKKERVVSRKLTEQLFRNRHHSAVVYPIRIVYMTVEAREGSSPVQVLVSVSKRHFKHAVDRNRVKRQIREAYRHNKHLMYDNMKVATDGTQSQQVVMAFIWLSDSLQSSDLVEKSVVKLLKTTADRLYNEANTEEHQ